MSVATVVTMGYGTFGSVNLLPTIGYSIQNVQGRLEYTIPLNLLEYTLNPDRLEFTIPKSTDFEVNVP